MSVEVRDVDRVERRILDAPSAPRGPWPHPNMKTVDPLPSSAPTAQLRRKQLADKPLRLYRKD